MKDADSTTETGGTSQVPIESEVATSDLIQTLRELCENSAAGDGSDTGDYRAAFHATVAPLLPDLLWRYEAALDDLQAMDSHCQSLGKALERARRQIEEIDSDEADQAAYAAAFWRRDELSRALRSALASPAVRAALSGSGLEVTAGDGADVASSIRVSHSRKFDEVAYAFYVLEPGRGYHTAAASSDDSDAARGHLGKCHEIALAIIEHPLVRRLLVNDSGDLDVGPPSGNILSHPKPGMVARKNQP